MSFIFYGYCCLIKKEEQTMNQAVLEAKKALVSEIQTKFSDATSTVVMEYRGLSVVKMTELRRQLSAEGVELKIYKNKMATRAAEAAGYAGINEHLTGPNAIAFGTDAVAPSRILSQFAKKNKALVIKSGIVEGKVVDLDMIKELSTLPNRDGMISMILGLFQAPIRNFAYALSQVAQTKEDGTSQSEATPEATETKEVVKEAAPEVKETKEVVKEATPEVKETKEVVKETAPEVKETKEVVKEAAPEVKETKEVVKEATPEVAVKEAPAKEEVKEEKVAKATTEETKTEDK
jgi:large subunit ribosomal protein L10